jgi:hypothetical protein
MEFLDPIHEFFKILRSAFLSTNRPEEGGHFCQYLFIFQVRRKLTACNGGQVTGS